MNYHPCGYFIAGDFSLLENVDLAFADSLILIISGRGTGGSYTLQASVTRSV